MKKGNIEEKIVQFCLVILPLIFLPNQSVFDYYYFIRHFILLVCFLILIIKMIINRNFRKTIFKKDMINVSIGIFIFLALVSVFFAENPYLAFYGDTIKYDGFITMSIYTILFLTARDVKIDYDRTFKLMIITATIISIYGAMQYFGFDFFLIEDGRNPYHPCSTIGNQNFLGTYFTLLIPIALYLWTKFRKPIYLLSYSIIVFGLLVTLSRGPWLGTIFGVSAFFLILKLNNQFKMKYFLIMLGTTALTILVFSIFSEESFISRFLMIFFDLELIFENPNNVSAGSFRWFIWAKVIELIKEKPLFGFGISNLGFAIDLRYREEVFEVFKRNVFVDEAHNEFLDLAVSCGVPSMIAYINFLFTSLKYRISNKYSKFELLHLPLLSASIGYIVQSFFNISIISVAYLFWIILGLLLNNYEIENVDLR
ncbi:MAG TPA: hypothetical protein DCQ90_05840 [Erysipelotrichaceae bacterium]|nr:hypothetical protein [Erysipelotrichaceae bacterium]